MSTYVNDGAGGEEETGVLVSLLSRVSPSCDIMPLVEKVIGVCDRLRYARLAWQTRLLRVSHLTQQGLHQRANAEVMHLYTLWLARSSKITQPVGSISSVREFARTHVCV